MTAQPGQDLDRQAAPTSLATVDVDFRKVLAAFKLDPGDPRAHALVYLGRTYQLDPLLGEITLLDDGGIYIGHKGRLRKALESPELVAIDTVDPWTTEDDPDWHCRCTVVVHRHDRDQSFTRTGRSAKQKPRKSGGTYNDPKAPERAEANAEVRALIRAFPIRLPDALAGQVPLRDDDGPEPPEPVAATLRRVQQQQQEQDSATEGRRAGVGPPAPAGDHPSPPAAPPPTVPADEGEPPGPTDDPWYHGGLDEPPPQDDGQEPAGWREAGPVPPAGPPPQYVDEHDKSWTAEPPWGGGRSRQ